MGSGAGSKNAKAHKPIRWILGRIFRGALVCFSIFLFLYFAHAIVESGKEIAALDSQIEELQSELQREQAIHRELEARIELLNKDSYIEVLARQHLRMIMPGDVPLNWISPGVR